MTDSVPILEFDRVTASVPEGPVFARDVSLRLRPGELGIVRADPDLPPVWIADLAQGLLEPDAGTVRFGGRAWRDHPPREALAARGLEIGRVFSETMFLGNLDLDENITLAARHHGRRGADALADEARGLAVRLGLSAVPTARPAWAPPREREAAQWIRALLDSPKLVLVEAGGLRTPEMAAAGAAVLADLRRTGAAALWIAAWDTPPPPGPAADWEQVWKIDVPASGPKGLA